MISFKSLRARCVDYLWDMVDLPIEYALTVVFLIFARAGRFQYHWSRSMHPHPSDNANQHR